MAVEQLDLLAPRHVTEVYTLDRLWGLDSSVKQSREWWAWRCICGRDVGAERRCAYSGELSAAQMAWYHRRDSEPWIPLPPMPDPYRAKGKRARGS